MSVGQGEVVDPSLDAPRPPSGDAFSDAVTLAFADPRTRVCALLRVGLAGGRLASGLGVVFVDGDVALAGAEGGVGAQADPSWRGVTAAGVSIVTAEPLAAWSAAMDAGDGARLEVTAQALGPPGRLRGGGMDGFEQPVRVRGRLALAGGQALGVDALGQRGRAWGEPDWSALARVRSFGVWPDRGPFVVGQAVAREGGAGHGDEEVDVLVFEGDELRPATVPDPLVTTAWDGEGRQRRAGLELWDDDGDDPRPPRRAHGDVLCGTTLDLGRLRMDVAFLRWRIAGRDALGRLDVLRRAG